MKLEIRRHWIYLHLWAIARGNQCLCTRDNKRSTLRFENIDEEYAVEKFNANVDRKIFLFENEEDAYNFLEYLDPIIIMEVLAND